MIRNLVFDTKPLVVHAQGPLSHKPYWKPIRDRFFQSPAQHLSLSDLTVFTWNNGHEAMGVFEKSMAHLGLPCMVLGQEVDEWMNSKHKPLLTAEAMKHIKTEFIMGVDSRDAILLGDPSEILNRFLTRFGCDLVFSADLMNWPNVPSFKKFEDACAEGVDTDYKYLNSGAFIGRTAFCKGFFAAAADTQPVPQAPRADQGIFKKVFQDYYPKVQLDYRCELFQNIGFVYNKTIQIGE